MTTNSTPTTGVTVDCEALLLQGASLAYITEAQNRGLCASVQVAENAPLPPVGNAISEGGTVPIGLLAALAIGACIKGLDWVSVHGAKRLGQGAAPAALPGGYVGQPVLNAPTNTPPEYGLYTGIQPIQTYTDTEMGGAYTPQFEPSPWAAGAVAGSTRGDDRAPSDLSTEACWAYLKRCTVAQFQEKIGAGEIDPVACENGAGKVTAKTEVFNWFQHGILETGKVGWAVFGCDGQGGSARAKATANLVKEFRAEFYAIA